MKNNTYAFVKNKTGVDCIRFDGTHKRYLEIESWLGANFYCDIEGGKGNLYLMITLGDHNQYVKPDDWIVLWKGGGFSVFSSDSFQSIFDKIKKQGAITCIAGCKRFTGDEVKHHKDCPNYKDSLSEIFDNNIKTINQLYLLLEEHEPNWYLKKHYNIIKQTLLKGGIDIEEHLKTEYK